LKRDSDIKLKSPDDILRIGDAGKIIAKIFRMIRGLDMDGVATLEIDSIVDDAIRKSRARASFKTVTGYGHATCISINDEVVHGIPSKKKRIKSGDIVKIDIGVVKNGFFADSCFTFPVGAVSDTAKKLMDVTRESLGLAIEVMLPGKRLGDIGAVIQAHVEKNGCSVVRDFTGHGVGYAVHELPNIPHYGRKNTGILLSEGMVLAIEPMVNEGKPQVLTLDDGWTTVTADGKLSAQFEHTIALTKEGPLILTK
jgi:methionyl aminopeptidase